MPLDKKLLAEKIKNVINSSSTNGPIQTTTEMEIYADAIISTLKAAATAHSLVTGTAPPAPGPVADLKAENGTFLPPLTPALWISILTATGGNPGVIAKEANASTSYLQSAAKINFLTGTLQGNSTAAAGPPTPGILVAGGGSGGKIEGLEPSKWAQAVLPPGGDLAFTTKLYTEIINYIALNADVLYPPGTVLAQAPATGAPLAGGTATGGIIS